MNSDTDFYFEFSSELIYIWMNKRTKPREIRKYCLLCSLHMLLACLKPTSNPYQNQNDSILLCSKTCPIEIESSKNGWEYQPSNGIASNVTWWARNRRGFEWSSVFTTSFGKHHCANWRGGRSQLKLLKVSNLKTNALHLLHFQAFFILQNFPMSIYFTTWSTTKSERIWENCTRYCHWNCVACNWWSHRSSQWYSILLVSWILIL